jgi:hypothetical protein
MGEEIKNDVILFCWDKYKETINEIIFEKYSSSLIKSGFNKLDKIYLIKNCNENHETFKLEIKSNYNIIYKNTTTTYLRFFFSKKTKFRVKVIQKNSGYFFFGFGNHIRIYGDGVYYYPKENEIFEKKIGRKKVDYDKYLKGFNFELNKKIGVRYSKVEKSIYFYMDGEKYLFYDNYIMPKDYRAAVTCSGFDDSFKVYNFKK